MREPRPKPKAWTAEDRDYVRRWAGVVDPAIMAVKLGRSLESIVSMRDRIIKQRSSLLSDGPTRPEGVKPE